MRGASDIDLLGRTAELVDIGSVSHHEAPLADHVEAVLHRLGHVTVERVGDNVVARTSLHRPLRIVLAGHLDTVPPNGNARARVDGDELWGVGSADMKGGLAVMLACAEAIAEPAVDVTWVFYAGEEVASEYNGLGHLFRDRRDLVAGDVALLGEPTGGWIEAGCQGSLRVRVTLGGVRAHTARPWMGRNAAHRAGHLVVDIAGRSDRRPVIDGCEFREATQVVSIEGGVAANVVPDRAVVTINHRFAPDRDQDTALAELEGLMAPHLEDGDVVEVVDVAGAARPSMSHPLLAALRDRNGLSVRAKLGWTDVARFAAEGIPAANFGPGDAALAHNADERINRRSLEQAYTALADLLRRGA